MQNDSFDYESFKQEALKELYAGKPLMGENGIFTPLLKHFLEATLQGELDTHLREEQAKSNSNRRNGSGKKQVRSSMGKFDLETPRDRAGSYEPIIVPKRQTVLTDQLESKIISMYGRGMSYSDISGHLQELYGFSLSAGELSSITDRILPVLKEWQNRPLYSVYVAFWLDAMYYKVRLDGSKVVTRVLYSVIGLNLHGKKAVLGIYLSESEGAKFWLSVLQDLKQRGVEDVLFACVDGLKGFPEAIQTVFPQSLVQLCVVHQIRYALRLIPDKNVKEFMVDLKAVYQASNLKTAEDNLLILEEKWGKIYPQAVGTWTNNWVNISTFFDYSEPIRKLIYTTNTIESYHRNIRKFTKTKAAFTSDNALLKLAFLAIQNMEKIWNKATFNWKSILSELLITFGDRIQIDKLEN
ncbi:IS256 family transposase [Runella salmonicolor]|uniref:Mutator family transposase n=1 Tax=Runella salmonicolor TaxID=2950278 RepID=A0ABT1FPH4_9BACT|nr:IS256 family transposase [Runella salmonicolor]MCP1383678.1 IS256 family transposase [Runella salmonicolor]